MPKGAVLLPVARKNRSLSSCPINGVRCAQEGPCLCPSGNEMSLPEQASGPPRVTATNLLSAVIHIPTRWYKLRIGKRCMVRDRTPACSHACFKSVAQFVMCISKLYAPQEFLGERKLSATPFTLHYNTRLAHRPIETEYSEHSQRH